MNVSLDKRQLLAMSQQQLDALFTSSSAGPIPDGQAKGMAIIAPGTAFSPKIAAFVKVLVWQGKTFDAARGALTNRILPFGFDAIAAGVYRAPSWLDQKECIVLDYSKSALVTHWIRDEIRLIGPQLYLGKVYWNKRPLFGFCLEFG